jgi:hypothetical protein
MTKRKMAAFRLPLETIAQLDVLASDLQRRSPGKVSQADAIAWAVARAINDLAAPEPTASPPPAVAPEPPKRTHAPRAKSRVAAKGGKIDREAETSGQDMDGMAALKRTHQQAVQGLLASQDKVSKASKVADATSVPPVPIADVARRLVEAMRGKVAAPARSPAPAADVAAEAIEAINAPIAPMDLKRHIPEFDGPGVAQPQRQPRKKAV